MTAYAFVTLWKIQAPIERVWEALYHPDEWPTWWPNVESVVELAPGGVDGVGCRRRYTWKTPLRYKLSFEMTTTRVERPRILEGRAKGELDGTGCWMLSESDGVTTARYDWNVQTTKAWMNLLAPVARPLFAWNHDMVMRSGAEGLARYLKARLVEEERKRENVKTGQRGV
jgi:hypothetical protein